MVSTFERLPARVKRDVDSRARKGERHPDSTVAALAQRWAERVMASPLGDEESPVNLVGGVVEWDLGLGGGAGNGKRWDDKRLARLILALPAEVG